MSTINEGIKPYFQREHLPYTPIPLTYLCLCTCYFLLSFLLNDLSLLIILSLLIQMPFKNVIYLDKYHVIEAVPGNEEDTAKNKTESFSLGTGKREGETTVRQT